MKLLSWLFKAIINVNRATGTPIRVAERQMDGCMAHYCSRDDRGIVIDHDFRLLLGHSATKKVDWWLIKWDEETGREPSWYPACFFNYTDDDGIKVRFC